MSRKLLTVLAGLIVATVVGENVAQAGAYTVYIYNTRRPEQGWFRAGVYSVNKISQVYVSFNQCRKAIEARVQVNRAYRNDFEKFAIVYQNSPPPEGRLRSYVSLKVIYIPGRGFVASAGSSGPTLVKGDADFKKIVLSFVETRIFEYLRDGLWVAESGGTFKSIPRLA